MGESRSQAADESRWRLRNWRVRARLVALILVPTAAAVLLGAVQVLSSTGAATEYAGTNRLARLTAEVGGLAHELEAERARVAWHIATGRRTGREAVTKQIAEVDSAAGRVRALAAQLGGDLTGRTADEVEAMLSRLTDLAEVRKQAVEGDLLPGAAIDLYTTVVNDLLTLHDEVSKGSDDDALFRQTRVLHALALAKESLSLQQALFTVVMVDGRFEQEQLKRVLGELSREQDERRAFADEATAEERRAFDESVNSSLADRALFLRELLLTRAAAGAPLTDLDLTKRDDVGEWFEASGRVVEAMRKIETDHAARIVARSEELSATESQRAFVVAAAVLALLVAVLLITTGVARSLVKPLRRLRREALEVAGRRLPEVVQRLREGQDAADAAVPPIGVFSKDEVGEVARAFDEVHREAVRLAGDEAKLRANVNAMFVNLSRRSQTLVERQLTLIERLERGERDDTRLGDLFKLDHLATRMRRNSENLLVLAGQETARKWTEPVELLDVVRAAVGEVESYDRVSVQVQSDVAVAGQAVNDVVHLLAELVENAVSFSRHDAKVYVSSNRIDGGGLMVSVTDHGIGMAADELAQANWRLANPPVVDVSVARRMGLFVVGRLALRHDIRVQLRPQDVGGLTAMVLLPDRMLTAVAEPAPPPRPAPGFDGPPPAEIYPNGHPSFDYPSADLRLAEPYLPETRRPDYAVSVETLDRVEAATGWFTRTPAPTDGVGTDTGPLERIEAEPPPQPQPRTESAFPLAPGYPLGPEPDPYPVPEPGSWFVRPAEPGDDPHATTVLPALPPPASPAGPPGPSLPAGTTQAGLPRRTPKANLMPGTPAPPPAPLPPVSPDHLRDRLSTFQQGVRKGRAEIEEDPR